jgi:23S rRNA pseudouridine1911/1915/1917 synthase
MCDSIGVLYEDNHTLAVNKPAGTLVQGDATGDPTLLDTAREYVRQSRGKPGNVYLSVLHRLDRPVSGVVMFARTSKAAARLAEAFRRRTVGKIYLALVEGALPEDEGDCVNWLQKDRAANHSRVTNSKAPGAKQARLHYRDLGPAPQNRRWVEVAPETGRSHQIRVQLAHLGCPITGDLRYGASSGLGHWIALHALQLIAPHPTRKESVRVRAPLPDIWAAFGTPPVDTRAGSDMLEDVPDGGPEE